MIRRVASSVQSFKEIALGPGLNILVADTTPESSDRQTRNRAGKSSFVELVHFLTGSDVEPSSIFRSSALQSEWFEAELDVRMSTVTVRRSGSRPSRLALQGSAVAELMPGSFAPAAEISNEEWKKILGANWFGIPPESPGWPTFRSLFPYFARRDASGGFQSPFKHFTQQSQGQQQVAMSFLLGLDWTVPLELQRVREQEAALRALRAAASTGAIPGGPRQSSELRSLLAVAEERANVARRRVESFRVLAEYEELQDEANSLTIRMRDLSDSITADRRLVRHLRDAVADEAPPDQDQVVTLYEEAGVALPGVALRRLEDVVAFHQSIVANRRSYLEQEILDAETRVSTRTAELARLDARRGEVLQILEAHGALSQFADLQAELSRLEAASAALRQEYSAAERVEGARTDFEIARGRLMQRLRQDHSEREGTLRRAIVTFEAVSSSLYEEAGRLEIGESPDGPTFRVAIQGGQSHGVRNMQIFCMDLTLLRMAHERGIGPGFLIHDSHLFDGVDERQVGRALQVASDEADALGVQYIATMNSDVLPTTLPAGFDLEAHILPVRLTDESEEGGLFGFRF